MDHARVMCIINLGRGRKNQPDMSQAGGYRMAVDLALLQNLSHD